jgi:NAD(P)-dependent dehydrogenase (short-subunit alcohol dehydrogenase family)
VIVASSTNASVLLTGASRGLGYALAEEYLEHGSRVVVTVRDPGRTALHDLQQGGGGRLETEHVDSTKPEQVQALRVRLGARRLDLLLVNASVTNKEEETTADVTTAVTSSGQGSGTVCG